MDTLYLYWLLYATCSLIWSSYWLGNFIINKKKKKKKGTYEKFLLLIRIWPCLKPETFPISTQLVTQPRCTRVSVYNESIDHPALPYTTTFSIPEIKVWSMVNTSHGRKIARKHEGWYRFVGIRHCSLAIPSTKLNSVRGHLPADSPEDRHVLTRH